MRAGPESKTYAHTTFATRLVERGVHHFVISALLGHSTPLTGFGFASRITPGCAHATWDAMVAAVESLEHPAHSQGNRFGEKTAENPKADETRKVGQRRGYGVCQKSAKMSRARRQWVNIINKTNEAVSVMWLDAVLGILCESFKRGQGVTLSDLGIFMYARGASAGSSDTTCRGRNE